jgi:hypothetical protein
MDAGWPGIRGSEIRITLREFFPRNIAKRRAVPCSAMNTFTCGRLACALVVLVLAGCETHSISNSGYDHAAYRYGRVPADGYVGELSELDVVGIAPDAMITDADIATALRDISRPQLQRNSRILLIQSGADFPDEPMVTALSQHFRVLPFSGRPTAKSNPGAPYAKTLRLAAARGGYDKIICYWGVLESEQKESGDKGGLLGADRRLFRAGPERGDAHPTESGDRRRRQWSLDVRGPTAGEQQRIQLARLKARHRPKPRRESEGNRLPAPRPAAHRRPYELTTTEFFAKMSRVRTIPHDWQLRQSPAQGASYTSTSTTPVAPVEAAT